MKKQHKEILRDLYDILNPSNFTYAVYRTPAQQMRDSADELERRERIENSFREMLEELWILEKSPTIEVSSGDVTWCVTINNGSTKITTDVCNN